MRDHFRSHLRAWLLLALLVVIANEVIDRVFFDEYHIPADVVFAIAAVAIAFWGSYLVVRRRSRTL